MAVTGQTLVNPASGERITFRTTAAESNGELVAIELELPSGGRVPGPLHLHPLQEERFEVVRGTMRFRIRRERVVAGPGRGRRRRAGSASRLRERRRRDRARPCRDPTRAEDGAAVRDGGRARRAGTHDARGHPQAARARPLHTRVRARSPGRLPTTLAPTRCALAPLAWLAKRRGRNLDRTRTAARRPSRSHPPLEGSPSDRSDSLSARRPGLARPAASRSRSLAH